MHIDRGLIEERIRRELWERVLPLVERDRRPLAVTAGPDLDEQRPFEIGTRWGAPWATTWFVLCGEIPDAWRDQRVEAVVDLGFRYDAAGFQCEALVVDEVGRPVQGIHPQRTRVRVDAEPGPVTLRVEAASNPSFPQFRPSPLGSPDTAGAEPLYRFRRAELIVVDAGAESLAHDLDVLDGVMRTMPDTDPRRARLLQTLADALDALPDVARMTAIVAPLLATRGAPGRHRIVATGHAHIDTAWLWPTAETVRKCTRTFASAVRLMDEFPEYRFACSQAQQYAWIEERRPELFERIAAKVADGQWEPVGGMWVEPDMNLPSGESLVRHIVHGQRYFESRFGRRCTEVWIPDVFGYPASLPQVFAAGGMTRFVTQKLSWNTTNRFPHQTFWWEGLDGTRVLTHFPPVDTYNAEITPPECVASVERFAASGDAAWSDWSLMPFGFGDGGGGPTREMLERARRLTDLDGCPRVTLGTPAEFFEHVEREAFGHHGSPAPVPVWRGELYFENHRGTLTSQLRTKAGNRACEHLLHDVELWSATAGRPPDVDDIWRSVLTQQFHDILPGSSIAWVHADAERVHAEVVSALEQRLAALLDELTPAGLHVVNSASTERDEVAVVPADVADRWAANPGGPAETGASQVLADGSAACRVRAPAHGIVPLTAAPCSDRVVATERSLANRHLAVRWDDAGRLTSIIDTERARDLVRVGAAAAVLELAPDHPVRYDAWDLESWTPKLAVPVVDVESIEVVERGPLLGRAIVRRRFGPSTTEVTYTLRAGSPRLDIDVTLDWQHREHHLSMSFPIDVRADTAACGIQFGHVHRPTHRSTSWDAAQFEVCAHRYVDLSEPSFGVAVLSAGHYGHGISDGVVRVSLARAASYPDPDADRGSHAFRLALLPHGPGLIDVVTEAERFDRELRFVTGRVTNPPPPDVEPPSVRFPIVTVIGPGVVVDAVKPADRDPNDVVVRLHEAVGDRTRVTVSCDRPIVGASRCNLLEEPEAGHEVSDGVCAFTLRPFQIVTLRLTRAAG